MMQQSIRKPNWPQWRYAAFMRWFAPSKDAQAARAIKAEAERQAGER